MGGGGVGSMKKPGDSLRSSPGLARQTADRFHCVVAVSVREKQINHRRNNKIIIFKVQEQGGDAAYVMKMG